MSTELRHKQILDILEENGSVSVKLLTKMLFVSEATVRRDLTELEKKGALKRSFGGATPILDTKKQVPLFIRESMNSTAKSEICQQAAALIKSGDTIFIDGSSTVQYLVKYISHLKDIIVVTYSIKTAELMCKNHIKTYCTGGLLMENSLVCTGQEAIEFAGKINLDICFLSCKGISLLGDLTDTSEEETVIRRAFLKKSRTRVFLMTNNKFGNTYFHTLCNSNDVDYIFTNGEIPNTIKMRQLPALFVHD